MKAFNTQQCGRKVLVITDSDLLQVVGMREGTQIWSCAKFSFLQSCQFTLETGSLSRVRGLSCERENLEPLRSCCCPLTSLPRWPPGVQRSGWHYRSRVVSLRRVPRASSCRGFVPSRIPDWGPHPEVMAAELWASLAEPDDTSPEPLLPSSSCRIPFLAGPTGRDEFQDAGL